MPYPITESGGNTGAMLALFLPEEVAQALYRQVAPTLAEAGIQGPVAPEDYHITLVLLGEASVITASYEPMVNAIQGLGDEDVARSTLSGQVNGIGRFATSENGETQPLYASFDAVDLPAFRHQLMELANSVGLGLEQNHGFIPHITLAYVSVDTPTPDLRLQPIDVKFDELTLAWGDERREFSLDGDAYAVKSVAFDGSTQYLHGPGGVLSLPGDEGDSMPKTKDDKKPKGEQEYGDVKFADPKNKKYPIDTEKHVRAAWSYINQEDNAKEYSPEELAKVKAEIVAAAKKFGIQISDEKKSLSVVKQANGIYRWTSTSTNNIQDRDGETVSLKALQADVARTKMFGDEDGRLYFYHIPYPIGGAPDFRALIDGMLVETGEFYDQPVAKAVAEYCVDHPEGLDASGWGTSVGFMGVPDYAGIYHSVLIRERSVLPMSKAANAYTSFGVKNKMALTQDQQKALDTVLGDPALVGVVKTALSAQEQSKMADEKGVVRKAVQATQAAAAQPSVDVPVLKAGLNDATPQQALGFGKASMQTKDAAAVQAAVEAEASAAAAADDAQDRLFATMDATDAAYSAAIAEARAGALAAEPEPEAPPAQAKADPAPAVPATDPSADAAATQTPPAAKSALSDEDMAGIAKYVNDTVAKAVGDCMAQMKAEMQGMSGEMNKMQRVLSAEVQAKMLNEVPRTAYERLKAYGATVAGGITPTITDPRTGEIAKNPAFVEKGKNLPESPDHPQSVLSLLGFEN